MENLPSIQPAAITIPTTGVNFIILPAPLMAFPALSQTGIKPLTVITSAVNKPQYSGTPPLKPAKKFRDEQEEILRCKRRLDFASLGLKSLQRPQTATVMRRNERERNRVKLINNTFARLRQHLPNTGINKKGKSKKISKVDTLREAIDYIYGLQTLIDDHDAINAAFDLQHGQSSPSLNVSTDSTGMGANSPGSTCSSSSSSNNPNQASLNELEPPLSPEDEDLLLGDFASWLNEQTSLADQGSQMPDVTDPFMHL